MKKTKLKSKGSRAGFYDVYRKVGTGPIHITGGSLGLVIQDGCLIITDGVEPLYVFAPGQWLTVNQPPI